MIILYAIIGGLLYRVRGGGIGPIKLAGATQARIMFGVSSGALAALQGLPWPYAVGFALATWLGLVEGWHGHMDIGHNEGETLEDLLGMSMRGVLLTAPAGAVLASAIGPWGLIYAFCGSLLGIIYWIGWKIPSAIPEFQQGPPMAEVITGAMLWSIIVWIV